MRWIDTHCHLDASEFDADREQVVARAQAVGVARWVIPAVQASDFAAVRGMAHRWGVAYALGVHPLYTPQASSDDLATLEHSLQQWRDDPHLVGVGEIGLDHFVPHLDRERQDHFYQAQLALAQRFELPVILHVRRSADALLAGLRRHPVCGGLAHAFNGSDAQAQQFVTRGFCLGFGGAMTHERARQIRHLAATLPDHALVLETDAPDIPPQWLYRTAEQRTDGQGHGRNEPAQLPRIAQTLAALRGWSLEHTCEQTSHNACVALPRLNRLWGAP